MTNLPLIATPQMMAAGALDSSLNNAVLVTAFLQNIPEKLIEVTRPIQLAGLLTELTEPNTFSARTLMGDVAFRLDSPNEQLHALAQNQRPLDIFIQPGKPPTTALLIVPEAETPELPALPVSAPSPLPAFFKVESGVTVKAVVLPKGVADSLALPPSASPVSTPSVSAPASPAHALGKLTELFGFIKNLPTTMTEPAKETANVAVSSPQPPPSAPRLQPETEVRLKIQAIIPPDADIPISDSPDRTVATVIGKGTNGQLLAATGSHLFFTERVGSVPVGSKLLIAIESLPADSELMGLPKTESAGAALQHLVAALNRIDPQAAQHFMQTRIAQPDSSLPATMLFLFNAIGQGDWNKWTGKAVYEKLEKSNQIKVIEGVSEELQQASAPVHDSTVGDWRTWPLPFHDGSQFQTLRFYVHRDHDESAAPEDRPSSDKTRFLINLSLTQLGSMQMDGLSQKKQLDMLIRSEKPLPPALPSELRALYTKTLDSLGLSGSLRFQTGREHWLYLQPSGIEKSADVMT